MTGTPVEISVRRGAARLIVSLPHTGTDIPATFAGRFVSRERALDDTDWFVDELYDFVTGHDATVIRTPVSRAVIDVNRDPSGASLYPGQATTGLCPTTTFDGRPLYVEGEGPDAEEIAARRAAFFDPYHAAITGEIARLRSAHTRIVVYDCHSIRSFVPRLFEGALPNFNIGTNGGASSDPALAGRIERVCDTSAFSRVTNGRFRGGYITRQYGAPAAGVHAVQMEIAIRTYMPEVPADRIPPPLDAAFAAPARAVLESIIATCIAFAAEKT